MFGLEDPCAAGLVPERPEDGDENKNAEQPSDGRETFAAEAFGDERFSAGRDVDESISAEPKDEGGGGHEDGRNSESGFWSVELEPNGDEPGGEGRAGVHREVKPAKRFGKKMGVRSEEHTSELQSRFDLVCRLLLEKK